MLIRAKNSADSFLLLAGCFLFLPLLVASNGEEEFDEPLESTVTGLASQPRQFFNNIDPYIEERVQKLKTPQPDISDSDETRKVEQNKGRSLNYAMGFSAGPNYGPFEHPVQSREQYHQNNRQPLTSWSRKYGYSDSREPNYQPINRRPSYQLSAKAKAVQSRLPLMYEIFELMKPDIRLVKSNKIGFDANPYKTIVSFKSAEKIIAPLNLRVIEPNVYVHEERLRTSSSDGRKKKLEVKLPVFKNPNQEPIKLDADLGEVKLADKPLEVKIEDLAEPETVKKSPKQDEGKLEQLLRPPKVELNQIEPLDSIQIDSAPKQSEPAIELEKPRPIVKEILEPVQVSVDQEGIPETKKSVVDLVKPIDIISVPSPIETQISSPENPLQITPITQNILDASVGVPKTETSLTGPELVNADPSSKSPIEVPVGAVATDLVDKPNLLSSVRLADPSASRPEETASTSSALPALPLPPATSTSNTSSINVADPTPSAGITPTPNLSDQSPGSKVELEGAEKKPEQAAEVTQANGISTERSSSPSSSSSSSPPPPDDGLKPETLARAEDQIVQQTVEKAQEIGAGSVEFGGNKTLSSGQEQKLPEGGQVEEKSATVLADGVPPIAQSGADSNKTNAEV